MDEVYRFEKTVAVLRVLQRAEGWMHTKANGQVPR